MVWTSKLDMIPLALCYDLDLEAEHLKPWFWCPLTEMDISVRYMGESSKFPKS